MLHTYFVSGSEKLRCKAQGKLNVRFGQGLTFALETLIVKLALSVGRCARHAKQSNAI